MSDRSEETARRYEKLNFLGKAVYIGGVAARTTAGILGGAASRAARIAADTERAFQEGRREDVEDAEVIDEWDDNV